MDLVRLLGENVREARKRRHMSQEVLALDADMKRSYLSELERGKRNPSVRALGRLAEALGIDPSDLLRQKTDSDHD
jgi:transcriptional regulator with XRE-family HTH domain